MKIVYNIFVKVRKLWDAIFGKNGDGSEVKLAGTIDGATEKVELGDGLSLNGNTLNAEAGGTEVEPLASVSGSEPIFRGLKIDGVDYQGYRTIVEANAGHTASTPDLQDILIGDTTYKVPAGAYIATMSDSAHVSPDSVTFMRNNYMTTPCYVPYTPYLCRIIRDVTTGLMATIFNTSKTTADFVMMQVYIENNGAITQTTRRIPDISVNPSSTGYVNLTRLSVNNTIYNIPDGATNGLGYLTTAPTSANNNGIKIVVLSAEPATKYAGYLYIITA